MSTTLTTIKIVHAELFHGEIMAEEANGEQHAIDEKDFEKWLRKEGKLDFTVDSANVCMDRQITGKCDMSEYWIHQKLYHKQDLAEYLMR